jgi:glutathione S-transferase
MKFYNGKAPNPRRVRIFMAEKGVEVPRVELDLQKFEARTPEFRRLNSLEQAPILVLDDGTVIAESVAICRYLEELHPTPALFGADALSRARVEMWNRRMEIEVLGTCTNIAFHSIAFFKDRVIQVPAFVEAQRETLPKKWTWLDRELSDERPFVAGDSFSVADITGMTASQVSEYLGLPIPAGLRHVKRWDEKMRARPSWAA